MRVNAAQHSTKAMSGSLKLWLTLLAPWGLAAMGAGYAFDDRALPHWLPWALLLAPPMVMVALFFLLISLMISVRD